MTNLSDFVGQSTITKRRLSKSCNYIWRYLGC